LRGRASAFDTCRKRAAPACDIEIEAAGATLLYFPPYSTDLKQIEHAFSAN